MKIFTFAIIIKYSREKRIPDRRRDVGREAEDRPVGSWVAARRAGRHVTYSAAHVTSPGCPSSWTEARCGPPPIGVKSIVVEKKIINYT